MIRKKIIGMLFTLLGMLSLYAQQTIGNAQINRQVLNYPTSPNAYALDKVGKLPMDLFNGKANINLPIYTIELGDLSFPIGLSYNTGGIKQNEIASSVGLGWALSMPNSVSKSIFDKDDDLSTLFFKDINQATLTLTNIDPTNAVQQDNLDLLNTGTNDLKPDLYSYNLPGLSGSFIVNNNMGYTIPHEDIKIEKSGLNFKITDTGGTMYWLSPQNFVVSKSPGVTSQFSQNLMLIDSIRTAGGKSLKFQYLKIQKYREKTKYEKKYIITTEDNYVPPGYSNFPYLNPNPPMVENIENNTENLITKIIFPEGEVNFFYSGDDNLSTTASSVYRKDLNSDTGGLALKRIVVKDKSGKTIRKVALNYAYFEPTGSNPTYEGYRLKLLEKVDELNNTKHVFTYNEEKILPARNANSDDLWGYFNNNTTSTSNLPSEVAPGYGYGRGRGVNPDFTPLGVLTSIKYPTGAVKKLYYENNLYSSSFTETEHHVDTLGIIGTDGMVDPDPHIVTQTFTINPSYQDVKIQYHSTCTNSSNPPQLPENGVFTTCKGIAESGSSTMNFHLNGDPKPFNNTGQPITLKITRLGECDCGISLFREYNETTTGFRDNMAGGLRVKQIEDIDQNNVSNVFYYDYNNSGTLKKKFSYYKPYFRIAEPMGGGMGPGEGEGEPVSPEDYVRRITEVQTSGNAYTSYNSSNIVTYSEVTERNGLGEVVSTFTDDKSGNGIYMSGNEAYTAWQYGLPLKTIYKKGSDTLRKETFHYEFNPLKNTKAGFIMGNPDEIAFGMDLYLAKYHATHGINPDLTTYAVEYYPVSIYGAKIEKKQSKTTEYFQNNKVIETVTDYAYSDTDINKPINLKNSTTTFSDGTTQQTSYQYAHDKGNQLMIDKNMIDIPLESQVTQTSGNITKTLSKTETVYPSSLPHSVAGNLVLPLSERSYDLLNLTKVNTEVTYDRYDNKGNILQYTTKDGIPVSVVWGYNKTLPIFKIEGIAYSQIEGIISSYVNDSDGDALDPTREQGLILSYERFRKEPILKDKMVTTYTHDPLIGVTNITSPTGIRETYIYDNANRLNEVRVREKKDSVEYVSKKVKELNYNYKH